MSHCGTGLGVEKGKEVFPSAGVVGGGGFLALRGVDGAVVPAWYAWAEFACDVVVAHYMVEGNVVFLHKVAGEGYSVVKCCLAE